MASGRFVAEQELRQTTASLLDEVSSSGEPCFITHDGKAKAVLMDINRYNALMDLVEESEFPKAHEVGDETRKVASVRGILKHRSTRVIRRRRYS